MTTVKLFCLAHAGGSAAGYSRWRRQLEPWIELCPLELNGRGAKANLPFYESIQEAATQLFDQLQQEAGDQPYALLGHSMGTLLVYEMCMHARKMGFRDPAAAFFSGRIPPHLSEGGEELHKLPDEAFAAQIKQMGLSSPELFDHPELLKFFLPIIRSDYRLLETYTFAGNERPLSTDFFIWTGRDDPWTRENIHEWSTLTTKGCQYHEFEGGHFFIYERTGEVLAALHDGLRTVRDKHIAVQA
ncbi:thioesterase [Paenibacillus zeisoli]|uniref:Thioesterase n=1 Tax=Paenibacillus zeisoli TaxID=2496267 RepID=A0A3S1D3Z7_9BACL|nr:thioesterase domain-containing protein [Paenibacillus zeisoli]RUT36531.1 thioesterase [Paenibacillus zeisoli]